jgi:hypothetical protein
VFVGIAFPSNRQIERQVADVAQAHSLDHHVEKLRLIRVVEFDQALSQFRQGKMVDAIEVTDAQCNGGDARGQRLSSDGRYL